MNNVPFLLAGFLALAGAGSCGHMRPAAHALYQGDVRPVEQLAHLQGPVAKVDGIDVSVFGSSFALLPGCHVVLLQARIGEGSEQGAWSADLQHVVYAFRMKAGNNYNIEVLLQRGNTSVGNSTVGDVKINAVERDAHGKKLGLIAPVRSQAEIDACQAWTVEADGKSTP